MQNGQVVMRVPVDDVAKIEFLLALVFRYERPEISQFRKAVEQFTPDLPAVLTALREMLIQHVPTEEIFSKVFGEDDFHRQNNVAKELYALEGTFFTGDLKKRTLRGLAPYYAAIRAGAAQIGNHHEKQTFLKVIHENLYKRGGAEGRSPAARTEGSTAEVRSDRTPEATSTPAHARSPRRTSSTTSTPSSTTPSTARSTPSTSSANSRASPSTPSSASGPPGARN